MKAIGKTDSTWSLQQAIQAQIEKESWKEWALRKEEPLRCQYKQNTFKVTQEIKQAFASSFDFISSLPKL